MDIAKKGESKRESKSLLIAAENKAVTANYVETNICCILTSDPAKHAIQKTAEVAYFVGQLWEEIA